VPLLDQPVQQGLGRRQPASDGVEAKCARRDATAGRQQAKLYADFLEKMTEQRPMICYTDGYVHYVWDDQAGYPPRAVQGLPHERPARAHGPAADDAAEPADTVTTRTS